MVLKRGPVAWSAHSYEMGIAYWMVSSEVRSQATYWGQKAYVFALNSWIQNDAELFVIWEPAKQIQFLVSTLFLKIEYWVCESNYKWKHYS